MAHIRKQIRDWLKEALKGSPQAGGDVFVRRVLPNEKSKGATLNIEIRNERSQDVSMDRLQRREVEFRVVALVKANDAEDGEDILDALAAFVEDKIGDDPYLGGLAKSTEYQATELAFSAEGEKTLCTAALTFMALVATRAGNPETAL